jgi:hypothetical protein
VSLLFDLRDDREPDLSVTMLTGVRPGAVRDRGR